MVLDYGLWNAIVSTATLVVVAAAAVAAVRQIRHLRAQNTLQGLLKVLDDWRDPTFREWVNYVRTQLPGRMAEPGFFEELDGRIDRARHPELHVCDWYEQVGSYMKHGLLDEQTMMDVSSGSAPGIWWAIEPVISYMRRTRGDSLYENFEYFAARGVMFIRAHPNGCYPAGTPRMRDLRDAPETADAVEPAPAADASATAVDARG
jgi:hypothetical protein